MRKYISLLVKLLVFMPLILLQTVISPKYKGIKADTAIFGVTGKLQSVNTINFLKSNFNRSETWI
jgi:hypothetical protein